MVAKYKFEKFDFKSFQDFIWDLIGIYQIGQIKFTPHQKLDLFNDHQLTHIGPVYNLNNPSDFLYVWRRNKEVVRGVTYEQFHLNKVPRIIVSYDIDEKSIMIVSLEGLSKKDIEDSLKKFFKISEIIDTNEWWKYSNPVWWLLQITRLPFVLFKKAGFNIGKIESSVFGKIVRWVIGAVVVFGGAILPILDAFGYKNNFVNFVKNIF